MIWLLACAVADKAPLYTVSDLEGDIDGYEDWAQPAGWGGAAPSCDGTHGSYVEIWYNQLALQSLAAGDPALPDGAALVEKGYAADKTTLQTEVAMRKVTGFAPDHDDWFWGQFDGDQNEVASGDLDPCVSCHQNSHDDLAFLDAPQVTDLSSCP